MLFDVVKYKLSKENMVIAHGPFYTHISIRESFTAASLWLVSVLSVQDCGTGPWTMPHHAVVVQLLSRVRLSPTPWAAACQGLLSSVSQISLRFMSIELVILSNHLILSHPLLLLPSTFSSHTVTGEQFRLNHFLYFSGKLDIRNTTCEASLCAYSLFKSVRFQEQFYRNH